MELAQLDEILRRYSDAEQRVADNLVELEARPTYDLLSTTIWKGVSAAQFKPAVAAMPNLWRSFQSFRDMLATARTRRGTGKRLDSNGRQSLEVLLTGPSVLIDVTQLPAEQRTLLGPSLNETWLTPEQLLDQMTADYDTVSNAVGALDAAWRNLVPALDRARAALASPGNDANDPALATVDDQLAAIERSLVDDPLGLPSSTLKQLDAAVSILGERRARNASLAADWTTGLQRVDALVADVRAHLADAHAAASEASAKISGAATTQTEPPDGTQLQALVNELTHLRTIANPSALARLEALEARLDALDTQAVSAASSNRAPLLRRGELRGLLSAYQAKAGASGLLEDARVAATLSGAELELYRAPTDLVRASQLVDDLGNILRRGKGT